MKFHLRFTDKPNDIKKAQEFRGNLFRNGTLDEDPLDQIALHGLIANSNAELVCVFRMIPFERHETLDRSYSAQFYNLQGLSAREGKALELGRFCIDPQHSDPDIIRLAWSELTQFVIKHDIDLLFGCSSFHGANVDVHSEALALLNAKYLAPKKFMPIMKASKVFEFAKKFKFRKPNLLQAQKSMPQLLRSYLMLGGWVSDHAVIDHDLNTVHVFTGVEVKSIPLARLKTLMGLLGRS